MLVAAQGRVNAIASGDVNRCRISWVSYLLLEDAWKEMAQTLNEANFGNIRELLEAEPPKWLPESAAAACMLCNVRFHPTCALGTTAVSVEGYFVMNALRVGVCCQQSSVLGTHNECVMYAACG